MSETSAALNQSRSSDEEERFHDAQESLGDDSSGEPREGTEPLRSKGGEAVAGGAEVPEGAEPRGREEWPDLKAGASGTGGQPRGGRRRRGAPDRKPEPPPCRSDAKPRASPQPGASDARGSVAPKAAPPQLWLPRDRPSKFRVKQERLGLILGKGGQVLRSIEKEAGARIYIDQSTKSEGYSTIRIEPGRGAARAKELIDARICAMDAIERGEGVEEMQIPQEAVGPLVGRGGETIRYIGDDSGACLKFDQGKKSQGFSILRIGGTTDAVAKAKAHVKDFLAWYKESGMIKGGSLAKSEKMTLNQEVVGMIIGQGGETLRSIQRETGAALYMDQSTKDQGYSTLQISGENDDVVDAAKKTIAAKIGKAAGGPPNGDEVCQVQQSHVGFLMGRGGANLEHIRQLTGTAIYLDQSTRDWGYSLVRIGLGPGAKRARELVIAKIREAETLDGQIEPENSKDMRIEQRLVRRITNEEGQPFQEVKERTGAVLLLDRSTSWLGFSTLRISGDREAVTQARMLVEKKLEGTEASLQARAVSKRARRRAARSGRTSAQRSGEAGRGRAGSPARGESSGGTDSEGEPEDLGGGQGPSPANSSEEVCMKEPLLCSEAVQETHTDTAEDEIREEQSGLSREALLEVRGDGVDGMIPKEMSAADQENLRRLHAAWEEDEEEEKEEKEEEEEQDEDGCGNTSPSKSKPHGHKPEELGDSSVASRVEQETKLEGRPETKQAGQHHQDEEQTEQMWEGLSQAEAASSRHGLHHHSDMDGKSPAATNVVRPWAPESIIREDGQSAQSMRPTASEDDSGVFDIETAAINGPSAPDGSDVEGDRAEYAAASSGVGWGRDRGTPGQGDLEAEQSYAPSGAAAPHPPVIAEFSGDGVAVPDAALAELKDLPTCTVHGTTDSECGGRDPLMPCIAREAEIGGGDMAAGGPSFEAYSSLDAHAEEAFGDMLHEYPTGWNTSGQWVEDQWGNWCLLYGTDSEWQQGEPQQGLAANAWTRQHRRGCRRERRKAEARLLAAEREGTSGAPEAGGRIRSNSPRPLRSCSWDGGRPRRGGTSSDESGDGLPLGGARRLRPQQEAFNETLEGADAAGGASSEKAYEKMKIPQSVVGWLIGRRGWTIDRISHRTGARLQFDQTSSSEGFSLLCITGSPASVARAKDRVEGLLRQEARARTGLGEAWSPGPPSGRRAWPAFSVPVAPGALGGSSLLRVVLTTLLGKWHGQTREGATECYEVAVGLMPSRPNGAQLACRTVSDGAPAPAERPIRYESGDIFLGERHRLFLDLVSESQLVWVDECNPDVSISWKRGWSKCPLGPGDGTGGYVTDDAAQAETSGTDFDTEDDGLPGLGAWDGSLGGRGRVPRPTSKQLAMRFQ